MGTSSSSSRSVSRSSSSSSPCGDAICPYDTVTKNVNCDECGSGCFCEVPSFAPQTSLATSIIDLECVPLSRPFDSLVRGDGPAPDPLQSTVAWIRVPHGGAIQNYRTVRINLNQHVTTIGLTTIGWQIYIIKIVDGPAFPAISPASFAKDAPSSTDTALPASVILPTSSGNQQYWVAVTSQAGFAQLHTSEWMVIFIRVPLTESFGRTRTK